MDDRLGRVESAVEEVRAAIDRLESRMAALETGDRGAPVVLRGAGDDLSDVEVGPEIHGSLTVVMRTMTLVGRSFLVLAGAFLLRALTEGGTFEPAAGVAVGVAYAVIWIVASAVAASRGSRASAGFYAACAASITGPLLFEATTSFEVLSPTAGIAALAGVTAAGWLVAYWWRLRVNAWVFSLGCLFTAASVATVRPPGEAATVVLVVLGLAAFWIAESLGWNGLKWVMALAADLAVLRLTAIANAPGPLPASFGPLPPTLVASLQAVLVAGFVGAFAVNSLRGRRPVGAFEFVQTAAVLLVGWGGAIRLAGVHGWATGGLASLAVIAGLAAYAGAFGVVDRKQGRSGAFIYLSSLGLGLVLVGLPRVAGAATPIAWAILALSAAVVGSRWDRVTLRLHAVVLLIAAWVSSGAASEVATDLGAGAAVVAGPGGRLVVVGMTVATTILVIVGCRRRPTEWMLRLPLAVLLLMTASAFAAAMVVTMAGVLPPAWTVGAGTVALSAVTVGLAVLTVRWGVVEAGWLVYPLLVFTGLRMAVVDLSSGTTLVLVTALAAFGSALIVSTRLIGRRRSRPE